MRSACDATSGARQIAETDADGNVLRDDPDDWQPRCADRPTAFCANPAYPNPVTPSGTVTLEFHNPVAQRVEIRIGEGRYADQVFPAGLQALQVEVGRFSLGYIEVEIEPAEQGNQIEGDLRIIQP